MRWRTICGKHLLIRIRIKMFCAVYIQWSCPEHSASVKRFLQHTDLYLTKLRVNQTYALRVGPTCWSSIRLCPLSAHSCIKKERPHAVLFERQFLVIRTNILSHALHLSLFVVYTHLDTQTSSTREKTSTTVKTAVADQPRIIAKLPT